LNRENFGPILHIVRFPADGLSRVVEDINATGYGLTLGLQSRIDSVRDYVEEHARVGNFYVNRNQIGAVVESQPFGGEGLSGTGPKAGGPHYVARFAIERVTCIDTTAAGGNASLMAALEG
jgi:RHH-type proline utilization regulon transcriptional repressor/proline dehydrogenase/delta 1-pyrroline-5-carboxylate dehydrogenase